MPKKPGELPENYHESLVSLFNYIEEDPTSAGIGNLTARFNQRYGDDATAADLGKIYTVIGAASANADVEVVERESHIFLIFTEQGKLLVNKLVAVESVDCE